MTKNDDFRNHLFFLFLFALILGVELRWLSGNPSVNDSIILSKPILLSENIFETISNIFQFLIPIIIFIMALNQKNQSLKLIYMIGALPLALTPSVIHKIGFNSLYYIKIISLIVVVMFLLRYLAKTYRHSILNKNESGSDNIRPHKGPRGPRGL
jgi:hypothetical protein